ASPMPYGAMYAFAPLTFGASAAAVAELRVPLPNAPLRGWYIARQTRTVLHAPLAMAWIAVLIAVEMFPPPFDPQFTCSMPRPCTIHCRGAALTPGSGPTPGPELSG